MDVANILDSYATGHEDCLEFSSWLAPTGRTFRTVLKKPEAGVRFDTKVESARAARIIDETRGGDPLVLCVSGGIDSESMMRAFLSARVPFRVLIVRFEGGLNEFDIESAVRFCDERSIAYNVFVLDAVRFFESGEYLDISKKYACQSPQLAVHLRMLAEVDGMPVLSGYPLSPKYHAGHRVDPGLPGELHAVYARYFRMERRNGVPFFFLHTPELALALAQTPPVQSLFEGWARGEHPVYDYMTKCAAYRAGGFDVQPREDKYCGFEKLKAYYDALDSASWGTAFNRRYRAPLEKLFPLPHEFEQSYPDEILLDQTLWSKLDAPSAPAPSVLFTT